MFISYAKPDIKGGKIKEDAPLALPVSVNAPGTIGHASSVQWGFTYKAGQRNRPLCDRGLAVTAASLKLNPHTGHIGSDQHPMILGWKSGGREGSESLSDVDLV